MANIILRGVMKGLKGVINKYQAKNEELKSKDRSTFLSKYIDYDASSNIDGLNLQIRSPINKKFMKIGSNSLISGSFIFETEEGFINIGERTAIGASTFMSIKEIEIGDDVMISWGCTFIDNNSHSIISSERANDVIEWKRGIDENKIGLYKNWDKVKNDKIIIKDKTWIGFNCIILKGVTIGEGAVLGAGSVVVRDVPPYTLVMGNPAKAVWKTK